MHDFKLKRMIMHFMFHDYFVSYLSKYYWLFAENQKTNILHELSYLYVKTHKGIHNVQENGRNDIKNNKKAKKKKKKKQL